MNVKVKKQTSSFNADQIVNMGNQLQVFGRIMVNAGSLLTQVPLLTQGMSENCRQALSEGHSTTNADQGAQVMPGSASVVPQLPRQIPQQAQLQQLLSSLLSPQQNTVSQQGMLQLLTQFLQLIQAASGQDSKG